ncbi:DUF4149 domain-containing protein [Pseudomonas sp. 5P_3.1_Bac2]|uniref:DUF4149 domain-containing protein n=1 Tax=Pseudomonas sp. 5P_3.1_Bac2 TaxID=2971617 RepID=UPI00290579D8|nr:DUF4149 domain-containing protein [Pseudomonas sp. 5P_3.1_Bac2]
MGGLLLLHFLLLPAISHSGLASLLVEDLGNSLRPLVVGLAAVCAALQVCVLLRAEGLRGLWRDTRGQLLLVVLLMAGGFLLLHRWLPDAMQLRLFSYLIMAFAGMLLLLQPVPKRQVR